MSDPRYNTPRWRRIRKAQLIKEPWCRYCHPRLIVATVADHIIPHRGNAGLFWDTGNLQSLCAPCHSGTKQAEENNPNPQIGEDGWPIEPPPRGTGEPG
jgi:5-methylcytosine-specific restriction protein A